MTELSILCHADTVAFRISLEALKLEVKVRSIREKLISNSAKAGPINALNHL